MISSAWESVQLSLYEYGRGFPGGESLLLDPGERPWIWRHQQSHNFTGRSQPLAQRLCVCHSGFGLLTADFHIPQGYQGRSPCLVSTSKSATLTGSQLTFSIGSYRKTAGRI